MICCESASRGLYELGHAFVYLHGLAVERPAAFREDHYIAACFDLSYHLAHRIYRRRALVCKQRILGPFQFRARLGAEKMLSCNKIHVLGKSSRNHQHVDLSKMIGYNDIRFIRFADPVCLKSVFAEDQRNKSAYGFIYEPVSEFQTVICHDQSPLSITGPMRCHINPL